MAEHRIPLPVKIKRNDGGFEIIDGKGDHICYVHAREHTMVGRSWITWEEAEERAKAIARLITGQK